MKTLLLIRHAKSGWENPELSDFDRPLSVRGLTDAPIMADRINKLLGKPDKIYSSSATRAKTTALFFADSFRIDADVIVFDKLFYDNYAKSVKKTISLLDNSINTVAFIGHNPDITSLATYFSGEYFENIPTCGVVCIDFDTDNWDRLLEMNGVIRFYEYPKKSF